MSVKILVGGELEDRWDREVSLNICDETSPMCKEVSGSVLGGYCFGFEDESAFLVCSVNGRALFIDYVAGKRLKDKMVWLRGLARGADCRTVECYACSASRGRLFKTLGFTPVPNAVGRWELRV